MNKIAKVFIETLPILFGILFSYLFWQNSFLLFAIYIILSVVLILWRGDNSEFTIFIYGIIIGGLVEVIGTQVSGYQSFAEPDFLGIPIWLPIVWGYGFVAMKRIGIILKS